MSHHEANKHHVEDRDAQEALSNILCSIETEGRNTGRKNAGELYHEAWERRRKNAVANRLVNDSDPNCG